MLTTLQTSYTDTRAADLAWRLGMRPLPALAVLPLRIDEMDVQLRLLGASHQVILEGPDGSCSETVACLPGSSTPLPLGVSKQIGDFDYEFSAHVEHLSAGAFGVRAQELLALVAEHPHGLAGVFPGSPHAFTALLVHRQGGGGGSGGRGGGDSVGWRTWHAYPQEGRLVTTRTRVGVRVAQPA
ncbi:DUF2617 family protein [Streptomyces polyrhachis]|uniref:DUF2617 family protein n=1 Tax=Streptomyces polyrhachis TaxID=1282885 RepID=A0ABW2G8I4_9ACTN